METLYQERVIDLYKTALEKVLLSVEKVTVRMSAKDMVNASFPWLAKHHKVYEDRVYFFDVAYTSDNCTMEDRDTGDIVQVSLSEIAVVLEKADEVLVSYPKYLDGCDEVL